VNRTLKKIETAYKNNKPFVSYCTPESSVISSFFMKEDALFFTSDFTESGFVFAPFDEQEKAVLFPIEKSEFFQEQQKNIEDIHLSKDFFETASGKENHLNLVNKTIHKILNSTLKKIVVSREELVKLSNFDVLLTYQKLLSVYQNAFVYVWFHPKVGLWFGATPETLLHMSNQEFTTMSLAGTQVFKENEIVKWGIKELEEQQLVTDFIEQQLQPISTELNIEKKETVKAGELLHLKTKVEGKLNLKSNIKVLLRALHPTPAVCGLPRKEAFSFIKKNEYYKRDFYTGFLGELNVKRTEQDYKTSKLYVNLRCMQVKNKTASIYVGGGITKDSNAEKEWSETVSKSMTMKKVLNPLT